MFQRQRSRPTSIYSQLLLAFGLVVLTLVLIMSAVSAGLSYEIGRQRVLDQLDSIAVLKSAEIELWTNDLRVSLDTLLRERDLTESAWPLLQGQLAPAEARQAHDRLLHELGAVMAKVQLIAPVWVMDASGRVLVSTDPAQENQDLSGTNFYRQGLQRPFITPPFHVSPQEARLVVAVAQPIIVPGRGAVGVLAAYSDLSVLDRIMAEPAGLGQTGESYLVSADYAPLTRLRFPAGAPLPTVNSDGIRAAVESKLRGAGLYQDYHGMPVAGAHLWLPTLQVALVVEQAQAEAFYSASQILGLTLAVSVPAALLLAAFIALLVTRSIAAPLATLANTAAQIAAGDLTRVAEVKRQDEIGRLAQAFNGMTGQLRALIEQLQTDLEELKKTQAALRVALEKYRVLFENFPLGISITDDQGVIVETNHQAEQLLGVSRKQHEQRTWDAPEWRLVRPDGTPMPAEEFAAARALREKRLIQNVEMGLVSDESKTTWLNVTAAPIPLEGYGVALAYGDITERKEAEALIRTQKDQLAAQNEELLTQNDALAQQGNALAEAEARLQQINRDLEARVQARSAELSAANAELQAANTALLRAGRLKDEFLANMSHELRTPLTGILGLAEVMGQGLYGTLTPQQMYALELIRRSGEHLHDLINDILDLSKVEAGKLELQREGVDVEAVCHASLEFIRPAAQKKNLRWRFSRDYQVTTLTADGRRLKQMLVNLLNNAVKFTPEGGQIGLEVAGDPDHHVAHFTVWDTGIGIALEQQRYLFQPFVQLDGGLARKYEGTGLGLALVRSLAEMHGGQVTVESAGLGQGARFILTLPWDEERAAPPAAAAAPSAGQALPSLAAWLGRPPVILAADDNLTTLMVVSNYLEALDCQVITAQTGTEALAQAEAAQPDLILLDIHMPGLDGLTVLSRLRVAGSRVPVVALTALAMPQDRERCLAAGANDYLSKPMRLAELIRVITQWLPRDGPGSAVATGSDASGAT